MSAISTPAATLAEKGHKWTVHTHIDKYQTAESYAAKRVDETFDSEGNMLLNEGINLLWLLVANQAGSPPADWAGTQNFNPFDADHAHIGVGDNKGVNQQQSEPTMVALRGDNWVYMKMNTTEDGLTYPIAGKNQKIVFQSVFAPGVACFEWLEWTVANGNGNKTVFNPKEIVTDAMDDQPAPEPTPTINVDFAPGQGQEAVVLLNHKQESMGVKYSAATWIVTVEISLS